MKRIFKSQREIEDYIVEWIPNVKRRVEGSSGNNWDLFKRDSFSFGLQSLQDPERVYPYTIEEVITNLNSGTWMLYDNYAEVKEIEDTSLCPKCKKYGKWISFALVCDQHGMYL